MDNIGVTDSLEDKYFELMGNVMGLIVNEFIKVIKRPFVWIFLCFILLSFLLCAFILSGSRGSVAIDNNFNYGKYQEIISNIENRIESAESEEELKILENQRELYKLLYDNEISEESWRFSFLKEIFEAKLSVTDETVFDSYIEIAINDNWLEYYSVQKDSLEASIETQSEDIEEIKLNIDMYKNSFRKEG